MSEVTLLAVIGAVGCISLVAVVFRQPQQVLVRLFFAVGMLALAAEGVLGALALDTVNPKDVFYWAQLRMFAFACIPGPWLGFSITFARGEGGRSGAKWWGAVLLALIVPIILVTVFADQVFSSLPTISRVDGVYLPTGWSGSALQVCFILGGVGVLMNLERTFRASVGTIRWRLKFMVLGIGALFIVRLYTSSQALLYHGMNSFLLVLNSLVVPVACLLITRSVFREGVFAVTVYPSRTVLQRSVTVLAVGTYLLIVGALAKLVTILGGDAAFPVKAFIILLALAGLSVLLLSDRLQQQVKFFVSRHFHRPMHDHQAVWLALTEGTSSLMTTPDLARGVSRLISETFQILSVSIWVLDEDQARLGCVASTVVSESGDSEVTAFPGELRETLTQGKRPIDIDASNESGVEFLNRIHPVQFKEGGHRVCVPLVGGGRLLGLIMVGDRVQGQPYTMEEFDLLKCIADQVAANMLKLQLAQRLLLAKEMEAFQTMSTFFVHDLKNTASTLSLMLRNLPTHFEDPAFRADAVKAVGKSVERINTLISRASMLRQKLEMNFQPCNLNELIELVLDQMPKDPKLRIVRELKPQPSILLDTEQFQKVITNLVLNGWEAVDGNGEVRVTSAREGNWAVITVTDNGCGMSREFISKNLFRPFQTTKKKGIGIGMFHSKAIIEAHGGRIEALSEPGKGTTFRVLIPAEEKNV
ncbi:MAG: PEP-CTERM system histidine kinase PrsK [Pedosphaera sp.]|nr:PEP-CTERM system histidine kinase PrsK [Pedosphaera sp.]